MFLSCVPPSVNHQQVAFTALASICAWTEAWPVSQASKAFTVVDNLSAEKVLCVSAFHFGLHRGAKGEGHWVVLWRDPAPAGSYTDLKVLNAFFLQEAER